MQTPNPKDRPSLILWSENQEFSDQEMLVFCGAMLNLASLLIDLYPGKLYVASCVVQSGKEVPLEVLRDAWDQAESSPQSYFLAQRVQL